MSSRFTTFYGTMNIVRASSRAPTRLTAVSTFTYCIRTSRHSTHGRLRFHSTKRSDSNGTSIGRSTLPLFLSASLIVGFFTYYQNVKRPTSAEGTAIPSFDSSATADTGPDRRFVPSTQETSPSPARTSNFALYDALEDEDHSLAECDLPEEDGVLTQAPYVPPTIKRNHAAIVKVDLTTMPVERQLTSTYKYEQWTFNGTCPGPFIRAKVGDVLELNITNKDPSGNPHNIDSHGFIGPRGGAALTTVSEGETKKARFKLLYPGLYVYHCAAAPVPVHIANGMYGLIYIQSPGEDLPEVDREYYVMQSEFYHEPPEIDKKTGKRSKTVEFSYPNALEEQPSVVCFNGSESAVTRDHPLKAKLGEKVRIFFGNAGPNKTSAFHVIGSNFKAVYRDGDVVNPPGNFVATVPVPPGAATIVDMRMVVPGTYTLVDHALFRLDKGAAGFLNVSGKARPDIYQSPEHPEPCVGCKLHG